MTNITFDQFKQLDIRIGTVVEAEVPSWSHWVIKLTVDIGEGGEIKTTDNVQVQVQEQEGTGKGMDIEEAVELKNGETEKLRNEGTEKLENKKTKKLITIFAGLLGFYKPEEIKGKQFPFIVNLEPKKIGPEGDYSQGMMMAGVAKLPEKVKI